MIARKIIHRVNRVRDYLRLVEARMLGVTFGEKCHVNSQVGFDLGAGIDGPGRISIGERGWIGGGATIHAFGGHVRTGRDVFIGQCAIIYGHGGVDIGSETLVSMHCCILSSNHTVPGRSEIIRHNPDILLPTRIGRDVWLGAGVKVLGGVTIGDGCVVGAGAVVTKDLPSFSISTGVPARVVGERT